MNMGMTFVRAMLVSCAGRMVVCHSTLAVRYLTFVGNHCRESLVTSLWGKVSHTHTHTTCTHLHTHTHTLTDIHVPANITQSHWWRVHTYPHTITHTPHNHTHHTITHTPPIHTHTQARVCRARRCFVRRWHFVLTLQTARHTERWRSALPTASPKHRYTQLSYWRIVI